MHSAKRSAGFRSNPHTAAYPDSLVVCHRSLEAYVSACVFTGEVEADYDASIREPVSAKRVAHRPKGHKGVEGLGSTAPGRCFAAFKVVEVGLRLSVTDVPAERQALFLFAVFLMLAVFSFMGGLFF
jgi:hypothetical protein